MFSHALLLCLCVHMFNYPPPALPLESPSMPCHHIITLWLKLQLQSHVQAPTQPANCKEETNAIYFAPLFSLWRSNTYVRKGRKQDTHKKSHRALKHNLVSRAQTVIVWTKHTTYKHKACALRGSYLAPSVNSKAQNESIKRALRWFLFI